MGEEGLRHSKVKRFSFLFFILALLSGAATPVFASEADEAQRVVDKARVTFKELMADETYSWLHEHLKDARGLLIFPRVLKAGFFLGGSGGNGVLLGRDLKNGDWSQPAFYTIGTVSFGLQVGAEAAEVVVMVMTQKALGSLFTSSFKLGGDISAAAGPRGAGVKADVTADFISFARSVGIFIGLDLEGSVISVRETLNKAYYGKEVSPVDIVVKNEVSNQRSIELRTALKNAVR